MRNASVELCNVENETRGMCLNDMKLKSRIEVEKTGWLFYFIKDY